MQLLPLREYQREAVDATHEAWARGVQRPALVLATGLGKTVIFAHAITEYAKVSGRRVVVLVHRDELKDQAVSKLRSVAPYLNIGVVKAGENDCDADVIVASVQTLARAKRREGIRNVGLVVVDECHHATATSYLDVLEHFGCFSPERGTFALGVTATMRRADGIGLGQVWQEIVYERDILWGIRHGYLADVEGKRIVVDDMDMRAVRSAAGDYRAADLGDAFEDSSAPQVIAKAYAEHGAGRQGVAFTPTVATAHQLAEVMTGAGIEAKAVDGAMATAERQAVMRGHERGDFPVLTNCMVAVEGWDSPATEVAVIARNTQSAPLYIQMVGRVLRPNPARAGKRALVLDVVGVAAKHALVGVSSLAGIDLADDESLLEAKERQDAEQIAAEETDVFAPKRLECVVAEDVDLFHGSRFVWGVTLGGVRFVSAGDMYVVLVPEASGAYAIARLSKRGSGSRWHEREIGDLGYAMAWGEELAEREGSDVLTQKDRAWRSKKATVKARDLACKLGIVYADNVRGGVLADLIDQVFATRRIDRHVLPYLRKIGAAL
jgi:superfamily II DNA or RNA helicase